MRPTGLLHIGHWEGVLKSWVELQKSGAECFFFSADWHMLTTEYENIHEVTSIVRENVADWIACGVDPSKSVIFVQSRIKETAELFLLLSMITGVSMLENNPTYKEQLAELNRSRVSPPLLQKALKELKGRKVDGTQREALETDLKKLSEGEFVRELDVTHRILDRAKPLLSEETWRRIYEASVPKDIKTAGFLLYPVLQTADIILYKANEVPVGQDQLPHVEISREITRKFNTLYPGKGGKPVFPEPVAKLTPVPKLLGLDGRKMSKSYGNAVMLSDSADEVTAKLKPMKTDEKRQRLTDPGEPNDCNVYSWHELYSSKDECATVAANCRGAKWGCMDCKMLLAGNLNRTLEPVRQKRKALLDNPAVIEKIIAGGSEKAADVARSTLKEVREAMKIG